MINPELAKLVLDARRKTQLLVNAALDRDGQHATFMSRKRDAEYAMNALANWAVGAAKQYTDGDLERMANGDFVADIRSYQSKKIGEYLLDNPIETPENPETFAQDRVVSFTVRKDGVTLKRPIELNIQMEQTAIGLVSVATACFRKPEMDRFIKSIREWNTDANYELKPAIISVVFLEG